MKTVIKETIVVFAKISALASVSLFFLTALLGKGEFCVTMNAHGEYVIEMFLWFVTMIGLFIDLFERKRR